MYDRKRNLQEIREAQREGNRILPLLESAEESLSSARRWGIFDMIGGGFITDLVKHSKMNDAKDNMQEVNERLKRFKRELDDIYIPMEVEMNVSGFATFADFFFDGLFADWYMQSKIVNSLDQVREVRNQVEAILRKLAQMEQTELSMIDKSM